MHKYSFHCLPKCANHIYSDWFRTEFMNRFWCQAPNKWYGFSISDIKKLVKSLNFSFTKKLIDNEEYQFLELKIMHQYVSRCFCYNFHKLQVICHTWTVPPQTYTGICYSYINYRVKCPVISLFCHMVYVDVKSNLKNWKWCNWDILFDKHVLII